MDVGQRQSYNKCQPHIPHGKCSCYECDESLGLVLAEVARPERKLRPSQKEYYAKHGRREDVEYRPNRPAKSKGETQQDCSENNRRAARARPERNVACHAARAMAHGYATKGGACKIHRTGRRGD